MSKELLIKPIYEAPNVVLEYSKEITLTKDVRIDVPNGYEAYFGCNEEFVSKLERNRNARLLDLVGKEFKGKLIKVAYVRKTKLPLEPWGFGQVRVKNTKLNVTYNVGLNGKYQLEVTSPVKLIKTFPNKDSITFEMIKEKTKPYLEPVARPVLASYFDKHDLSIFEVESHIEEIRKEIVEALTKEDIFKDLGVKLKTVTINGIHIPDEDMNMIKQMVNNYGISEYGNQSDNDDKDRFDRLDEEISKLRKEIKDYKDNDTVLDELDNLKMELLDAIKKNKSPSKEELDELEKRINELRNK